jgi:hypothetical protein
MYWTGKSGETLRVRRYHRSKTFVSQHIIALLDIITIIGIPSGTNSGIPFRIFVYDDGVSQSDITTIKVSKGLRDRISAGAAQQHQTVQRFIENVLEDHERRRRLAAVAEAMGNADERTLDDWRAETDVWEAAEADTGPGA